MGLSAEALRSGLDALADRDSDIKAAVARIGYPEPRIRERGYATLLRTIVGQQVSFKAAASIWGKLEAAIGDIDSPAALLASGEDGLRAAGLSRQKVAYATSLAGLVADGALDFDALPVDDEAAIAAFKVFAIASTVSSAGPACSSR